VAIQKSITDENGVTHTSYTRIRKVALDTQYDGTNVAEIHIEIYASAATRSKSDASVRKLPIKQGLYQIEGTTYNTYFADSVLDDVDKSPLKQAYTWLKTYNDTDTASGMFNINWTTGTSDV